LVGGEDTDEAVAEVAGAHSVSQMDPDEALAREVSQELEREVAEMELEKMKAGLLAKLAAVGDK